MVVSARNGIRHGDAGKPDAAHPVADPSVLRAEDSLLLPAYKGATLRGGFGVAFKDAVCTVEHRTCERCLLRSQCAYPYVFETPVPEGMTRMRKYPSAPHPFVFLPPLEEKTRYRPGETLTFDMTLIGKGAAYLPYFITRSSVWDDTAGSAKAAAGSA